MTSEKYKKAEKAYVEFFQEQIDIYSEDITKRRERNDEFPSDEELKSDKFAKDSFHDHAFIDAIIQNLVKGRAYE